MSTQPTATPVRMIRTRFLGPTDHRGARVVAHSVGAGNRKGFRLTVSWDHALDACDNHEAAAKAAFDRLASCPAAPAPLCAVYCCSEDGGGYVFAFVPTEVQS